MHKWERNINGVTRIRTRHKWERNINVVTRIRIIHKWERNINEVTRIRTIHKWGLQNRECFKNRKKTYRLHNLSVACQLDLFDTIAKPILLYGCEVWGVGNKDIVERVQLKFWKFYYTSKGVTLMLWYTVNMCTFKK